MCYCFVGSSFNKNLLEFVFLFLIYIYFGQFLSPDGAMAMMIMLKLTMIMTKLPTLNTDKFSLNKLSKSVNRIDSYVIETNWECRLAIIFLKSFVHLRNRFFIYCFHEFNTVNEFLERYYI